MLIGYNGYEIMMICINRFNLATCSPQDYLYRTIYPTLSPLLSQLTVLRPSDPIETLALLLLKSESEKKENVAKLNEIYATKEKLREQLKKEYNVTGRI